MLRVQIRLRFGNICACISLIHTNTIQLTIIWTEGS